MLDSLHSGEISREEELGRLEQSLQQLKINYEHYFLGQCAREPSELRADLQRKLAEQRRVPIRNTAVRFRLSALASRFQAYGRHWNKTLREIESGSYARHLFKEQLHRNESSQPPPPTDPDQALFDAYRQAAISCGQSLAGLTPTRLHRAVAREEQKLKERFGSQAIEFCVVVVTGRVKLRARPRCH